MLFGNRLLVNVLLKLWVVLCLVPTHSFSMEHEEDYKPMYYCEYRSDITNNIPVNVPNSNSDSKSKSIILKVKSAYDNKSEQEKKQTILDLPPEILFHISTYLDAHIFSDDSNGVLDLLSEDIRNFYFANKTIRDKIRYYERHVLKTIEKVFFEKDENIDEQKRLIGFVKEEKEFVKGGGKVKLVYCFKTKEYVFSFPVPSYDTDKKHIYISTFDSEERIDDFVYYLKKKIEKKRCCGCLKYLCCFPCVLSSTCCEFFSIET